MKKVYEQLQPFLDSWIITRLSIWWTMRRMRREKMRSLISAVIDLELVHKHYGEVLAMDEGKLRKELQTENEKPEDKRDTVLMNSLVEDISQHKAAKQTEYQLRTAIQELTGTVIELTTWLRKKA